MLDMETIEIISELDYIGLLTQGAMIGLILGGSIGLLGGGINQALKLFKII